MPNYITLLLLIMCLLPAPYYAIGGATKVIKRLNIELLNPFGAYYAVRYTFTIEQS